MSANVYIFFFKCFSCYNTVAVTTFFSTKRKCESVLFLGRVTATSPATGVTVFIFVFQCKII